MALFDEPWKNLAELFFQEFTQFFWPEADYLRSTITRGGFD
ncbi:hypothetical protein [Acanthopleuribacter pedis]|nr:hypothetical protein [Acanthopleuribacter pedis]